MLMPLGGEIFGLPPMRDETAHGWGTREVGARSKARVWTPAQQPIWRSALRGGLVGARLTSSDYGDLLVGGGGGRSRGAEKRGRDKCDREREETDGSTGLHGLRGGSSL